jgi:hypothetical protein
VNAPRQVDLYGSLSARDAAGRTLNVHCAGTDLTIDADSVRGALSALRALRMTRTVVAVAPRALDHLSDFRIELRVRGRPVGRAGPGARAGWLAGVLTKMPLELHAAALIRAALKAF